MKTIPVLASKGGVGKSFVTINSANALNNLGYRIGVADIDITGPSVLKYLSVKQKDAQVINGMIQPVLSNGIQYMSAAIFMDNDDQPVLMRGKSRAKLIQQFLDTVEWRCDYLLLDCPPGGTDELNYLVRFRKKEIFGAIVVATPSDVAMTQVRKTLSLCQKLQVPVLGIVANMTEYTCPKCNHTEPIFADGQDQIKIAAEQFHVNVIAKLPMIRNVDHNPLMFTSELETALKSVL
jgi:ATP-binding protein involved in chromosome partitioning